MTSPVKIFPVVAQPLSAETLSAPRPRTAAAVRIAITLFISFIQTMSYVSTISVVFYSPAMYLCQETILMTPSDANHQLRRRRRLPRSFKDLTPSNHFNPRTFFREMVWKALLTKRTGQHRQPVFPRLSPGQVALTWIGHASFLAQFSDLNVLIDPNFANWIFLLKRLKRTGLRMESLPPADLVLLTHAHFDHFHKPTLRRLPAPKVGVMPWGVGDLARNLGFARIIELKWWEGFSHLDWKVTLVPAQHWGARMVHDEQRGYGAFVLEHQGRSIFHGGDSGYFDGFKEIGKRFAPEIALLPIGAYFPESFRTGHM